MGREKEERKKTISRVKIDLLENLHNTENNEAQTVAPLFRIHVAQYSPGKYFLYRTNQSIVLRNEHVRDGCLLIRVSKGKDNLSQISVWEHNPDDGEAGRMNFVLKGCIG